MILLDTNVLSALMQTPADETVAAWLDGLDRSAIWLTAVTIYEVSLGIRILADGQKKQRLGDAFGIVVSETFAGRIIELDTSAALQSAAIHAHRRKLGRPIDIRDAMIAGIAKSREAELATRNVRDFEETGVTLIDPWTP